MATKDERKRDGSYQQWLKDTDKKDTKTNHEWYHTEDKDRASFIKDHKSWWKNF